MGRGRGDGGMGETGGEWVGEWEMRVLSRVVPRWFESEFGDGA